MNISNELKKKLWGHAIQQEYLCTSFFQEKQLRTFLTTNFSTDAIDVSNSHLFLGYKPVVFGVYGDSLSDCILCNTDIVCLSFHMEGFKWNKTWRGFPTYSGCVAKMILKRECVINLENNKFYLFKGVFAEHGFLTKTQQLANRAREYFKRLKSGNVFLPGNLYEQVRVAYSRTRQIAMITLGSDGLFNMFPTDLHGLINNRFYASSLRLGGKACEQVHFLKTICISSIDLSSYKRVYDLGKNHMMDLHTLPHNDLHDEKTEVFKLPLPLHVLNYKELQWKDFYDVGIHRIFIYEVVNEKSIMDSKSSLAHIHRYYAQWRINMGIPVNCKLR